MNARNITIRATSQRMADGWTAVLEFPNGGRMRFSARHGTQEAAELEAAHGRKCRLAWPECAVPDPEANRLVDLREPTP